MSDVSRNIDYCHQPCQPISAIGIVTFETMSQDLLYIDFDALEKRFLEIQDSFQKAKPFRFVSFDGLFHTNQLEQILRGYPRIEDGKWDGTTYINQKNKFQKSRFEEGSTMQKVFGELNSTQFINWLQRLTQFDEPILADPKLFGGGLHQSINGAFLNVHVDYNIHPETKFHRRLNVIVYMNENWKDEYEGHLELWDLTNDQKNQIARISPSLNRCVIFETNEISFHGHPTPLNTPAGINRKSLATYYYTETRPTHEVSTEHNTIYVNTEGVGGKLKQFNSGIKAFLERINKR